MVDNKILKHKFLFLSLVIVFSVLFGKLDVNAEESEYKRIHITTYYTQPGSDFPYREQVFDCWPLANIALVAKDLEKGEYIFATDNPSGFVVQFDNAYTTTVKRYNSKMEYCDEYLQPTSKQAYYYEELILHPELSRNLISDWKPIETDIPIFRDAVSCKAYFETGDTSGQINKDINFHDFSQDTYTVDIPVPELSKLCFTGFDINNNPNDIYNVDLIIQTNYYGVSYQKKGFVNVYAVDYDWIYKKHYYNISDSKSNHVKKSQINVLDDFGVDIFSDYVSDFISWGQNYPNITDLPNYSFIWYNSVASQTYYNTRHVQEDLIDETTLKTTGQPEVIYYVRFYDDSGNFGRWARYLYRADDVKLQSVVNVGQLDIGEDGSYIIDDNGNPSTSQTITTNQNFITNETENNRLDFDITSATNFFDYIKNIFDSIISSLNSFGNLIKACLGFLPDDLLNAIVAGIVIMLFVGVVKVVRG